MGRFSSDNSIEFAAFDRQRGRCGLCGKFLAQDNFEPSAWGAWTAHHVNGDPTDNRLGNCVCLCVNKPESCHLKAHHGDFAGEYLLPKSEFPYWNG